MATNNVIVSNLCKWPLYFKRATGVGDITIPANAKRFPMLTFDEVLTQIQLRNPMFIGTDGMGNHARIQILDEGQRRELFGIPEQDAMPAVVVDQDAVRALLAIRGKTKFHDQLNRLVKTSAEKKMLLDIAEQVGGEDAEAWKLDALRALAKTAGV